MRKILISCFACFVVCSIFAQPFRPVEAERLNNWMLKGYMNSAIMAKDWVQAQVLLTEWCKRKPLDVHNAFNLALAHYNNRQFDKAILAFNSIASKHSVWKPAANYYLALIHKQLQNYALARQLLSPLKAKSNKMPFQLSRWKIEQEIMGCDLAILWQDTAVAAEVVILPDDINFQQQQFAPSFVNDSLFLFGSRPAGANMFITVIDSIASNWSLNGASLINDKWARANISSSLFPPVNNFNWSAGVFSPDSARYYFAATAPDKNGKLISNIFFSSRINNHWSFPVKLPNGINRRGYSSSHPAIGSCFDPNLEVIYFVSNRPGGVGGYDIWFAIFDKKKSSFKKAENAGIFINSPHDELFPFFDLPSHALLFASNGWAGIGGFDIFRASGELVSWDTPVNLGFPINSSADDVAFIITPSAQRGIIVSNRAHNPNTNPLNCCDQLFDFHTTKSPRVRVKGSIFSHLPNTDNFLSAINDNLINSDALNALNEKKIRIQRIVDSTAAVNILETKTNNLGEFDTWLDPDAKYRIIVLDSSLVQRDFLFQTSARSTDSILNLNPVSLSLIPHEAINIDNIFYLFDQVELSDSAKISIDNSLLKFLLKFPHLNVEIHSHTDNLGDERYNDRLSLRRASNVVNYLIKKGIDKNRLAAKGFGERLPLLPNQKPDGSDDPLARQTNRRTEFIISANPNFSP